jgi:hypothetical protein
MSPVILPKEPTNTIRGVMADAYARAHAGNSKTFWSDIYNALYDHLAAQPEITEFWRVDYSVKVGRKWVPDHLRFTDRSVAEEWRDSQGVELRGVQITGPHLVPA